ncbi:family 78 glycoside hydrolase catalytic domain [Nocardia sp. NPDC050713]|uniref:family 78 glycoside hydrolase catalytic domain n=1 Tax=Nocardia sp. NPDC050713 TaxID=3154511 RepID=UPI0033DB525D
MRLERLRTLHRIDPLGIDQTPEFSWNIAGTVPDTMQRSYRLTVDDGERIVWDSGIVHSEQQSFVEYGGPPLRSRTPYRWSVRVEDNHSGIATASAEFETAFLDDDWVGRWVESTIPRQQADVDWGHGTQPPAVEFLRRFDVRGGFRRARLYATALGAYRPSLNGARIDDRELAPEFSVYRSRLYYQTYDVTTQLRAGGNELSLYVGDGWYFCPATRPLSHELRTMPAILFQLEVHYEDGSVETIASDGTETCRTGPVRSSDLYWGERYDATAAFGDPRPVEVIDLGRGNLVAQPIDPIRPMELLPARTVDTSPDGDVIVDFGQIIAGRIRVRIDAPAGTEVTLEHFEVPTVDGGYFNSTYAGQKDVYVSDGTPREYEPLFTFHGFRYVRVSGLPVVRAEDFTAVLLTTPKERTGFFECSDAGLNRLHENVLWSQRNNMMSIPTDCPTREKAGFTGDIQIYTPAAFVNEDVTSFLTAWLRNLAAEQHDHGVVPMTVPFTTPYERLSLSMSEQYGTEGVTGIAGWSDAAVIVPWEMYRATGNTMVLRESFSSMSSWCDTIIATARAERGPCDLPEELDRYLWNTGFHFGEWLIPSREQKGGDFETTKESAAYVAPFFGYRSVRLLADIAGILGLGDERDRYAAHAEAMKDAIQRVFMTGDELPTKLMGGYVLAFAFDLVPAERWQAYAARLVELIEANDGLLDTGFLATPYLLDVLVRIGRADIAIDLLWERRQPSWLYQVDMGATAIWENWKAIAPDGTPGVSSFDHYAFGCVDDWICREVAGIKMGAPGYKHAVIAPRADTRLTWCSRSLLTEFGELAVRWTQDELEVVVPCNTTATVHWRGERHEVGSGSHRF